MRAPTDVCGCFPTGRHYPGIAERLAASVTKVEGLSKLVAGSERWVAQKLAVIDFETTGLSPQEDRIIEIGVACFEAGELTGLKNWLVHPQREISEEIFKITKIDPEEIAKAPPLEAVIGEFAEMLRDHLPVAYNAPFDSAFLASTLARRGDKDKAEDIPAFDNDVVWIDPLVWAREHMQDLRSKKLVHVAAKLGIPLDNAHRAASDAEATGRVLLAMADRLPATYGELIRLQAQYAARQEVDMSATFRRRT